MKKLLLIPALCLLYVGCDSGNRMNNSQEQTQETSSDWEITTKVKSAIMTDTSISASSRFVSVTTTDGEVTLTGEVSSEEDKNRIVEIVKEVSGVRNVDDQMTVSSD